MNCIGPSAWVYFASPSSANPFGGAGDVLVADAVERRADDARRRRAVGVEPGAGELAVVGLLAADAGEQCPVDAARGLDVGHAVGRHAIGVQRHVGDAVAGQSADDGLRAPVPSAWRETIRADESDLRARAVARAGRRGVFGTACPPSPTDLATGRCVVRRRPGGRAGHAGGDQHAHGDGAGRDRGAAGTLGVAAEHRRDPGRLHRVDVGPPRRCAWRLVCAGRVVRPGCGHAAADTAPWSSGPPSTGMDPPWNGTAYPLQRDPATAVTRR